MVKFHGEIGYGETVETPPGSGVYRDVITERKYFGDVVRTARQLQEDGKLNKELTVQNSISVVADAYANQHFSTIRYIKWAGTRWTVTNVSVERPRLIFTLGGVYNGPVATSTPSTP